MLRLHFLCTYVHHVEIGLFLQDMFSALSSPVHFARGTSYLAAREIHSITAQVIDITEGYANNFLIPANKIRTKASSMAIKNPSQPPKHCVLPCTWMRAGTSKALFINRKNLPGSSLEWGRHLVSALGSRGNDSRQIDGIGGGLSTTSKVAVVAVSDRPDADIDWTFVQVAVGRDSIDMTGTCGNVSSGVGPYALQSGLVKRRPGEKKMDIRIYNTNTDSIIVETMQLDEAGNFLEIGNYAMPGVPSPGSEVRCAFLHPAGSMTGKLFPSGQQQQTLRIMPYPNLMTGAAPFDVRVTLIDAANPFVFIDATSMPVPDPSLPDVAVHAIIESIRCEGAVAMGLASNVEVASKTRGTPKVALLYPPPISQGGLGQANIRVQSYSMGLPHPSFQLTGAVCLATALNYKGTVAAGLCQNSPNEVASFSSTRPEKGASKSSVVEKKFAIAHNKGVIEVFTTIDSNGEVQSCAVSRTARKLFEGNVSYYI